MCVCVCASDSGRDSADTASLAYDRSSAVMFVLCPISSGALSPDCRRGTGVIPLDYSLRTVEGMALMRGARWWGKVLSRKSFGERMFFPYKCNQNVNYQVVAMLLVALNIKSLSLNGR